MCKTTELIKVMQFTKICKKNAYLCVLNGRKKA